MSTDVLNEAIKYILFQIECSLRLLNSEQSAKPILTGCFLFFFFFIVILISSKKQGAQKGQEGLLLFQLDCNIQVERK